MSYRMLSIIPVILVYAACSGGSDADASAPAAASSVQLGLRGLPGHQVTVRAETLPQAGAETTFAIQVEPAPQAVSVWLSAAYDADSTAFPVAQDDDGLYRIRLIVPPPCWAGGVRPPRR